MAWFDRNPSGKKESEAEQPVGSEPRPQATAMSSEPLSVKEPPRPADSGLVASLQKGSRVTGQLNFQGPAKIDGSVDGEIQCQGKLTIGEGADIRAKIFGQVVVIQGRVEGNVTAKEKVELVAPARLYGNIATPRLTITEGVIFDGDCSMGVAKQKGGIASISNVTAEVAVAGQAPKQQTDSDKR